MRQRIVVVIVLIFLFAFFVFRSAVVQDPDFGWHLQFGRLITSTGTIPKTDLYSYTMPSYHFVDHEWGMDVLIAFLYDHFGMLPLIIGFALVGFATLLVITKGLDIRWIGVPIFLIGGTLFEFIGVRPQTISWLFLAVLSLVLFQRKVWLRFRFFLPLLFLLWANLHGGFAIGIVVMGMFLIGQMLEKKQIDRSDSIILLLSLLVTLCNPYGYHLWTEVVKTATDPNLRTSIEEWYPAIYFTNLAFWIYAAFSVFLIIRYFRKFSFTMLVVYGFLFFSGIASMRNIPVFVIMSLYSTAQAIAFLYEEAGKHAYGKARFVDGYVGFSLVCLLFFLPQLGMFSYEVLVLHAGQGSYPAGAVAYLRKHLPNGQIFASYDWGGYLIWQLPQKKVFIDGRMPSWRNPNAPNNESTYALGEYQNILSGKELFASTSKKYGIDTLLASTNDLQKQQEKVFGIDVESNPVLHYLFHSNKSLAQVVSEVRKMGWREVYHDQTAVVFEK